MKFLKTTALATSLTVLLASSALAGGMAEPVMAMEPDMVVAPASSSSAELLVPLILITLIGIALAGKDDPVDFQNVQLIQVTTN